MTIKLSVKIGVKRYVALVIIARNIQIIGNVFQQKEVKQLQHANQKKQKAA